MTKAESVKNTAKRMRGRIDEDPQPTTAMAPILALALLLLVAVPLDGAFDLRYWAPLALLGIAVLLGAQFTGGLRIGSRPLLLAVAAVWSLAAWMMLSAAWAESAARAWESADRTILYAALVTVAATLPTRRQALGVGSAILAAVAAVATITLVALWVHGEEMFRAGRLEDPIGYRNGTAVLFALAVWPLIGVVAERGRNPALRSGAAGAAVLSLGLAVLTQSRGVTLGLAAGGLVFLAIGPDRLRRVWIALLALAGVALASGWLLVPFHAFEDSGAAAAADVHRAVLALTLVTAGAAIVGLGYAVFDNGLRLTLRSTWLARRAALLGIGAIVIAALAVAAIKIGNPATYASDKWDEFTSLEASTTSGETRLGSVGGQRYDLWRVAWSEFRADPIQGAGAGNYLFGYYRERRTDRNLSDPHGIPFSALSETGLVGTLLLGTFLVSLGIAIRRNVASASDSERRLIGGLAAAGTVVIAQSALDWFWLIPTILGLGVLALTLAAVPGAPKKHAAGEGARAPSAGRFGGPAWGRAGRLAAAALLLAAGASVVLLFLSDVYVRKARSDAGRSVAAELSAARTAGDLNPVAVDPLYLQASALETEGDRGAARSALLDALDKEPGNFITLALLGDLEIRAGRDAAARAFYRRAAALNPLDVGLQKLARSGGGQSRGSPAS
jgi:hypothetical protein